MTVVSAVFDSLGKDGKPAKLGIMGGTFDPIHIGHLAMADEVRSELGLDGVLFMPNAVPVFKRYRTIVKGTHRLEMCRRAVAGNPVFDVSALEIERGGDTFTIDTLRTLREHYPKNVELYLIAGSDSAASIGHWKSSAEIAELVHVAVAERPGNPFDEKRRQTVLAAAPFRLHVVEVTKLAVSSSDVRDRFAQGRPVRYLLPPAVWDYICETGLYGANDNYSSADESYSFESAYEEALSDDFFEARKNELMQRVDTKRFEHSMGVVETCERLAIRYGVDVKKARLAGLLHDWDKALTDSEARARVHELGLDAVLDPFVIDHMPRVLHAHTAAAVLKRDYSCIPPDVLQAIDRHTIAAEHMSDLDKVLYIADAIEPSRHYGQVEELRAAEETASLDELYFQTYGYWIFLLLEREKTLHPDTMRIWNSLVLAKQRGAMPDYK